MPSNVVNYTHGTPLSNNVYLDANFLIHAWNLQSPKYTPARDLLADLLASRSNLFITNLVIDEICWTLLRVYYKRDNRGQSLDAQTFKHNHSIIQKYHPDMSSEINKILQFQRLTMASGLVDSKEIIREAMNLMLSEWLLPRDAFHLAFIIKLNIEGFITADSDFDNLNLPRNNLTIYKY